MPVSDGPVTVAPNEEAVTALAVRVPPRGDYPDGGVLTTDSVRVRVRSLGLNTTHDVRFPLPLRVTIPPRLAAGPGCTPG